jgi:thioredoxin-like negative regulator of GroEL
MQQIFSTFQHEKSETYQGTHHLKLGHNTSRNYQMSEHSDEETAVSIIHCTSANDYYTALEAAGDHLVVVDCYAPWCPPCQQIAPIFEQLAGEYPHVVFIKVDMDQAEASLKSELEVWALPTFCFFRHGRKLGSFMGANVTLLRQGLEHEGRVSMCSMCSIQ